MNQPTSTESDLGYRTGFATAICGLLLLFALKIGITTAYATSPPTTQPTSQPTTPVIDLPRYLSSPSLEYVLSSSTEVDLRSPTISALHQLTTLAWVAMPEGVPNFGFTRDTVVVRFQVHNPQTDDREFLLYLDYPLLDHIEFALIGQHHTLTYPITGDLHPVATRPVRARNFIFPFALAGGETATLYLRIQATDTLQIPMHLFEADAFSATSEAEFYVWGLYYGAMFAMLMFTLCLLVILRDQSLIFFVVFVLCFIIVSLSLNGFLDYLLLREHPTHSKWIRSLFLSLGLASCLAFSIDYLKLRTYSPLAYRSLQLVLILSLISAGLTILLPFYYAMQITLLVVMFSAIFMFYGGVSSWYKGYTPAKYYVIAWVCFFIGGFANLLRAFAWIPTNLMTEYGVQLGSAINVMLLALGIAYRFDVERKQLFQAETRALTNEKLAQEERERRLKAQLRAQEEQLKSEKAHAETQAKSQFLANMSHEIRTPMNGVLGMTQLLKDTPLNTQQSHFVETIENSGNALLRIINDILDFSKIEAGKLDIEQITFDLPNLIDESTDIFSLVAAEKSLGFCVDLSTDVPLQIVSDPTRIKQILLNLLSNAFKFTDQGTVSLRITVDERENQLRFSVNDTGIGISAEQQQRLFLSFSQADSSTTRKYGGTGLGLVICQRLAELLGGSIGVRSDIGQGTEFWFTISLRTPQSTSAERFNVLTHKAIALLSADSRLFDTMAPVLRHYGATALYLNNQRRPLANWEAQLPSTLDLLIVDRSSLTTQDCQLLANAPWQHYPLCYLVRDLRHKDPAIGSQTPCISAPLTANKLVRLLNHDTTAAPTPSRDHTPKFTALRVLVTEDNKVNQMVIRGILNKMGIQPKLAENGIQAVQAMTEHPDIDCIIMDCEMPEMDGYEATRHIRTMPSFNSQQPLIIGLSANAMREQEQQALDAGMNHYLRKPVKFDEVLTTLMQAFPTHYQGADDADAWRQEAHSHDT